MAIRISSHLKRARAELSYQSTPKRIRADLGGTTVLDTVDAVLVWEPRRVVPLYAVPEHDLDAELVPVESAPLPESLPPIMEPGRFELHTAPGQSLTVRRGDLERAGAAFRPADPELGGRVVLDWDAFDGWREEEEPVIGHPHDPFARIDIIAGSRSVEVSVDGVTLASSSRPTLLFETGLPVRYYLPPTDVRLDLMTATDTRTTCAYKGHASYWAYAGRDVAWTYHDPLPEAQRVRDLIAFYAERTTHTVDGVLQRGFRG